VRLIPVFEELEGYHERVLGPFELVADFEHIPHPKS
jgi:hypothetical protein